MHKLSTIDLKTLRKLYKNRWGVPVFEEWQAERENKLVMSEENPFSLNLTKQTNN